MLSTIRKQTINSKYIPPQKRKQLDSIKVTEHNRLNKECIKNLEDEQEQMRVEIKNTLESTRQMIKDNDVIVEKQNLEYTTNFNVLNDKLETSKLAKKEIEQNIETTNMYISNNNKIIQQIDAYIFNTGKYIAKNEYSANNQAHIYNLKSSLNTAFHDKTVHIHSCTEYSKYIQEFQQILIYVNECINYYENEIQNINSYKNSCIDFYKKTNTMKIQANEKYIISIQKKIDWFDSLIAILKLDSNTKLL